MRLWMKAPEFKLDTFCISTVKFCSRHRFSRAGDGAVFRSGGSRPFFRPDCGVRCVDSRPFRLRRPWQARFSQAGLPRPSNHRSPMLQAMFASAAAALARSRPMARMASPVRLFRRAKTRSTFDWTDDLRPLAFAVRAQGAAVRLLAVDAAAGPTPRAIPRSPLSGKSVPAHRSPVARGFKRMPGSQSYHFLKNRLQRLRKVYKSKESQSCEGSRMLQDCICAGVDFDSNLQDRQ